MAGIYKSDEGRAIVERQYRAALQRWPVPNRQLTIPTREGDTFVIVSGEANAIPVVLFHGSGTNSAVWIRDIAQWAQTFRSAETRARMERWAPNLRLTYLENEGHLLPRQTAAIYGFLSATVSEALHHTG